MIHILGKMDKGLILNRIKEAYKLKNNAELSRFLDVAPNTITNWYARNSIDFELVFSKCVNINTDWLITGKGQMFLYEQNQNNAMTYTEKEKDNKQQAQQNLEYRYLDLLEKKNDQIDILLDILKVKEINNNSIFRIEQLIAVLLKKQGAEDVVDLVKANK